MHKQQQWSTLSVVLQLATPVCRSHSCTVLYEIDVAVQRNLDVMLYVGGKHKKQGTLQSFLYRQIASIYFVGSKAVLSFILNSGHITPRKK